MTALIGPSLMCADLMNLESQVREMDQAGVDYWLFPDEGVAHVARRAGASVAG